MKRITKQSFQDTVMLGQSPPLPDSHAGKVGGVSYKVMICYKQLIKELTLISADI